MYTSKVCGNLNARHSIYQWMPAANTGELKNAKEKASFQLYLLFLSCLDCVEAVECNEEALTQKFTDML